MRPYRYRETIIHGSERRREASQAPTRIHHYYSRTPGLRIPVFHYCHSVSSPVLSHPASSGRTTFSRASAGIIPYRYNLLAWNSILTRTAAELFKFNIRVCKYERKSEIRTYGTDMLNHRNSSIHPSLYLLLRTREAVNYQYILQALTCKSPGFSTASCFLQPTYTWIHIHRYKLEVTDRFIRTHILPI